MSDAADAPPVDPRLGWELPPFGQMPRTAELDECTTRVLAENPSPMALDGTNTYVVGAPGAGAVAVIDPGPDEVEHRRRVEQAAADRDAEIVAIVVTHHHPDHAEAARPWAQALGCRVHAATRDVAGPGGVLLGDGAAVEVPGLRLEAVATPGHTRDHLALRLPTGALCTGDHVLGRGTSVVAHPDGDMAAYLDSLRRVRGLGPDALYPGHGPELTEDPDAVLAYYLDHRRHREAQVLAALERGPLTPRGIVEIVYADVDPGLWAPAERSTRATVDALVARGEVTHREDDTVARRH